MIRQNAAGRMTAAVADVTAGRATVAEAAAAHDCDPGDLETMARVTVRAAVLERDGWRCASCLRRTVDVRPRLRSAAPLPCADPVIAFGMANHVAACSGCADLADRKRDESMHVRGFWLRRSQDPALVPIVVPNPSGPVRVWLLPDGGRSYSAGFPSC